MYIYLCLPSILHLWRKYEWHVRCPIVIKKVLVLKIVMAIIILIGAILIIARTIKMKWKVIPIVFFFCTYNSMFNNNNTRHSDGTNINTIVTRQFQSLGSISWNTLICFSILFISFVYCMTQYSDDLMIFDPKLYLTHIIMAQQ